MPLTRLAITVALSTAFLCTFAASGRGDGGRQPSVAHLDSARSTYGRLALQFEPAAGAGDRRCHVRRTRGGLPRRAEPSRRGPANLGPRTAHRLGGPDAAGCPCRDSRGVRAVRAGPLLPGAETGRGAPASPRSGGSRMPGRIRESMSSTTATSADWSTTSWSHPAPTGGPSGWPSTESIGSPWTKPAENCCCMSATAWCDSRDRSRTRATVMRQRTCRRDTSSLPMAPSDSTSLRTTRHDRSSSIRSSSTPASLAGLETTPPTTWRLTPRARPTSSERPDRRTSRPASRTTGHSLAAPMSLSPS